MNAIILCGGIGSRLGEIVKTTPKVLIKIGNKTVFDWQMEKFAKLGVEEVVLAAGHLSDVLRNHVGESWNGIKIIYAIEPTRLGTGGAIKFSMNYITKKNKPTWILNGDVLTTVDFADIYKNLKDDSDGIILGSKVENASSYGTLFYGDDKQIKEFKEKEGKKIVGFINGGVYLFNPQVSKYFPEKDAFSVEYDMFPNMNNLHVYESEHPWIDIGVPERLAWANENWKIFKEV
ncbi:MAG: NTP transferase domain-containing protein [Candidatus Magasanikbacteria bacterium]|nr:NTP transferase domain-containing protein [Candidatus Magasanikbacteria bacterium]